MNRLDVPNRFYKMGFEEGDNFIPYTNENVIIFDDFKYNLGLFFWERGGKQFLNGLSKLRKKYGKSPYEFEFYLEEANYVQIHKNIESMRIDYILQAQDFLDCLACLGEDKVKELIKELKEGVEK